MENWLIMKIAYVTTYDAKDVNNWSGLGKYIANTVKKYVGEISYIGPLKPNRNMIQVLKKAYYKMIRGEHYNLERTMRAGKYYARQVEEYLKGLGEKFDLVFSPGSIPIAYTNIDLPVIFWADATWASMINYYPASKFISNVSINDGNRMEQRILDKCTLAIFSSEWAANSAINDYQTDPD